MDDGSWEMRFVGRGVICGKYLAKRMKEEKRLKRTGFSPSALFLV
jgi:hypothetical protein